MHFNSVSILLIAAYFASVVNAHGAIIAATGDAGGQGTALGIDATTPRTGTRRRPFQQDTTIFDDQTPAEAQGCGRTLQGGDINMASAAAAMVGTMGGMPMVTQGGTVSMTVHQVNADGAGPYTCMVDPTGTGNSFQPMTVVTNVPGRNGRNRDGEATAFPLVAQMPAGVTCTGEMAGMSAVCMVRCQNPARAGPFGGCVPVQMVQPAPAAAPGPDPVASGTIGVDPVAVAPTPVSPISSNIATPVSNAVASPVVSAGSVQQSFVPIAKRHVGGGAVVARRL